MKVGIFTDTYFPQISGVSTSIRTLKNELEASGHEVIIFTTTDPQVQKKEENIVRLPSIPFISFKDRRMVIRGMIHAYEAAKYHELELVHTQTEFGVGILGKFVAKKLNIPIVHTYHTMYEDYLHYIAKGIIVKPQHVRLMTRKFCQHLDGVICPSHRVENKLHEYDIEVPMAIIPTGIDLQQFSDQSKDDVLTRQQLGISDDTKILLSLSRLSYEKNIQAIIEGMAHIIEKDTHYHLIIVGDGPYRQALEDRVIELSLSSYVTFVGEVANQEVNQYYRLADYFVSLSTSESQGLTYIEALAAKTPIIAKENAYLNQLIENKEMGLLLSSAESFAEKFMVYQEQVLDHSPHFFEGKLQEISSQTFGKKVMDFYEELIETYNNQLVATQEPLLRPKKLVARTMKVIKRTKKI
ncbi:glycosyltransferase family 4 protein [Vagococcus xieshaowenii]|uniref:Glycosyltransferase family 4 protein n=1 Tax=Vagococcus xieshaowenii TaxID=2562451 RepID=A0AAJ5EF92_9ENTE|nr:glycosyltransferase family 4 protein [Vagococcus xieshaowenii]QCA28308.1 glycosyltransferase family 4 protein [Vagococcus xieshaowenii]TFZ42304.1 glycosyltransferase family 4 protein [Vagococcus xieshaowenii]